MEDRFGDQSKSDSRPEKGSKAIIARPRIRKSFYSLNAFTRHKILINEYRLNHPGATALLKRDTSTDKTDYDILTENHRFLWESDEEPDEQQESAKQCWGRRLAKKYYDSLFKEFTICDLSRYKENKVAMRWRTEAEVVEGKGQLTCGEKTCQVGSDLRTWEVNFKYEEQGSAKNALVKLRLCLKCSDRLNFGHHRKEVTKKHKRRRKKKKSEKSQEKKHEQEKHSPTSSAGSSSLTDSEAAQLGSKRLKKKKSDPKSGERFLDKFLEDMIM